MRAFRSFLLLISLFAVTWSARGQYLPLPNAMTEWMMSPGMSHATVVLDIVRVPKAEGESVRHLYALDPQRFVAPASLLKLVSTSTALRLLGGGYVLPDSAALIDTTLHVPAGLEGYNPDWLLEDVGEDYAPPLQNLLPDSGRLLREVMLDVNHQSLNMQAETLMRLLTPSCRLDSGILTVNNYWKLRGLDTESLRMYDACGLAPSDRLTARFLSDLLYDMRDDKDFIRSLPLAGESGTVAHFLKGTRLERKARLKTGTTKSVLGYAGYITGSDGATYITVFIVNNYAIAPYALRKNIQKMLLLLIP